MKTKIFLFLLCGIFLAGCISREDADAKLARGCAAGAQILMTDGFTIKETKGQTFRESPEFGKGYREVNLSILESDEWTNNDKDIICVFSEEFGFFGMAYTAAIYQIQKDGQIYGRSGDQILGTMEDHLKLMEAVEREMN
ncbi:MAG: hypothetical protein ACT4OY_03990 [Alphaproteobacteria bacterium]